MKRILSIATCLSLICMFFTPIQAQTSEVEYYIVIEKSAALELSTGQEVLLDSTVDEVQVNPRLRYSVTESYTKSGFTAYAVLNYESLTSNPNDVSCIFSGTQWVTKGSATYNDVNFSNDGSFANYLENEGVNTSFTLRWSIANGSSRVVITWIVYAKSIAKG